MRWNGQLGLALLIIVTSLHSQEVPSPPSAQPKTSICGTPTPNLSPEPRMGRLVRRVIPQYPKAARQAKLEGGVTLGATISKDGTVKDIEVRAGDPILAEAAVAAVRLWRYEPFLVQGSPVEVKTVIVANFVLKGQGQVSFSQENDNPKNETAVPPITAGTNNITSDTTLAVGGDVKAPKRIYTPDPTYTKSAQEAKTQGDINLAIVVTPEGDVSEAEVCKSLELSLDQRAIETVRRWKFEPATKDGKPVAVHINVAVSFRLY